MPPSAPALDDVLVGNDDVIRAARADLARLAASDVTVLVCGDSGTGKEIAARALHQAGPRRERPFVAVNCGAIPEALIDSELFGYHRGAFTGAAASHPGLFEQAHGGTIFLDEIGDLPVQVQARLLRVLQEGEVRPLGAPGPRAVDVRVVAATHVDLDGAVAAGRFRADLLYRLSVVTVELPPLRARRGDVPELAAHLLRRHAGAAAPRLTAAALHALTAHAWPGNVRELENALLHALALGGGDVVDLAALPPAVRAAALHDLGGGDDLAAAPAAAGLAPSATAAFREARARALAEFERGYLRDLLAETDGNVAEASRRAGLDRANLRRLLRRHDLDGRRRR